MASDEFHNDLAAEKHDALADYRAARDLAHALCDDDWETRDDEPDLYDDAMDAADQAWKEREAL